MHTSNQDPRPGPSRAVSGLVRAGMVPPARTHRSASSRPVAAGVWICTIGALAWLVTAGDLDTAIHAAPWLVLLSWFVYVSQWRPCLRIDSFGFEVINGLRDHRIPFGTVKDIEVRLTTVIWAAGKKYVSWGAPTPASAFGAGFRDEVNLKSRPFTALPSNERFIQPEMRSERDDIVAAWHAVQAAGLPSTQQAVVSKWNAPAIVAGLLAVVAVLATALL